MELPESIKHLPKHVVDELIERMEKDSSILQLREKQRYAYAHRDYVTAIKIRDDIERIKERYLKMCFDNAQGEIVQLGDVMKRMAPEDIDKLVLYSNALAMCCDMIEGLVMDFDQIYHKYEPHGSIIMYNQIIEVGKVAKENLRYMNECMSYFSLVKFADVSDDMAEMLLNKVKKMLREVPKKEQDEMGRAK